jgi:sulfate permease, SulP family
MTPHSTAPRRHHEPALKAEHPLFAPKILTTIRSYTLPAFIRDATAGVIVGIVALPLAIAFAIASGVTPDKGLTTAIIAGFLISLLGGSRAQIGGPTGAFVVIVYKIVEHHGVHGLTLCTLMAGALLVLMGVLRLGTVIKFIPYPVTVGFTSGIAVIIFSQQIGEAFGLVTGAMPSDFLAKWEAYAQAAHTAAPATAGLWAFSLAVLLLWPKLNRRVPASIVAILAATAAAAALKLPVETIQSRFGEIPHGLPRPAWPGGTLAEMKLLLGPAITVALLGAIESLLSATVADGMIEARHRSNTELIAQGVANLVCPLFGGIPATGAIARTATNIRNGGRTPVAGMVHAVTLLLITLIFGKWAGHIPLCTLAAILMVVAYHMSEWHAFAALLKAPRMDVAVLLTTFLLTVFVDLTAAVGTGMVLALTLFAKRMTEVTSVQEITTAFQSSEDEDALRREPDATARRHVPEGVAVYDGEGAFFFGAAANLREMISFDSKPPKALILRMRHVLALDASGIQALRDLRRGCRKAGTRLIVSGLRPQPLHALERAGALAEFGEENVTPTFDEALRAVRGTV